MKGVPVRLGIGARDLAKGVVEVARRDEKTKELVALEGLVEHVEQLLSEIQDNLFNRLSNLEKIDIVKRLLMRN